MPIVILNATPKFPKRLSNADMPVNNGFLSTGQPEIMPSISALPVIIKSKPSTVIAEYDSNKSF
jgi:hypothetical protein